MSEVKNPDVIIAIRSTDSVQDVEVQQGFWEFRLIPETGQSHVYMGPTQFATFYRVEPGTYTASCVRADVNGAPIGDTVESVVIVSQDNIQIDL